MHVPLREFQRNWDEMLGSKFLAEGGFASRGVPGTGFLGVVLEKSEDEGLRVAEVYPESAAEKAKLKVDDVIKSVSSRLLDIDLEADELDEASKLYEVLGQLASGDSVNLSWSRDGETHEKKIILGERP